MGRPIKITIRITITSRWGRFIVIECVFSDRVGEDAERGTAQVELQAFSLPGVLCWVFPGALPLAFGWQTFGLRGFLRGDGRSGILPLCDEAGCLVYVGRPR